MDKEWQVLITSLHSARRAQNEGSVERNPQC